MRSELVVDVNPTHISTALLEDGRLVALQQETRNVSFAVGNLYIAKVKKLMPGLNAAFVNVGYEKDAFLHYLDLGSQFNTYSQFLEKTLSDTRQVPNISNATTLPDKLPKSRFRRKDLDLPPKSLSPDALWSSFLLTTRFRCRKKSSRRRRNTAYAKSSKALSPRILVLSFAPLPKAKKWQS